jgi:hypothetical protein
VVSDEGLPLEFDDMKHLQILALLCATSVCASAATLCSPGENVVFSCPTKSGKQIAVCVTKDAVRYRYGRVGKIELEFPQTSSYSSDQFSYFHYFRPGTDRTSLEFETPGAHYAIDSEYEDGASSNGISINVKGNSRTVVIACAKPPQADWTLLNEAVKKHVFHAPPAGTAAQADRKLWCGSS